MSVASGAPAQIQEAAAARPLTGYSDPQDQTGLKLEKIQLCPDRDILTGPTTTEY